MIKIKENRKEERRGKRDGTVTGEVTFVPGDNSTRYKCVPLICTEEPVLVQ
jgi:hypothetical protein